MRWRRPNASKRFENSPVEGLSPLARYLDGKAPACAHPKKQACASSATSEANSAIELTSRLGS
jgi:hypothetical protein